MGQLPPGGARGLGKHEREGRACGNASQVHIAPTPDAEVPSVDTRRNTFPIAKDAAGPQFAPITSDLRKRFLRETADGEKGTAYQTLRHTWATAHNVGRKFKPKEEVKGKKKKGKKK